MNLLILGSGAMGTALAGIFTHNNSVSLWVRRKEAFDEMVSSLENKEYLPHYKIPSAVKLIHTHPDFNTFDAIVLAFPTQHIRTMCTQLGLNNFKGPIINTAKGMELKTFLTPSEILVELGCPNSSLYTLSGPSHAEEVAQNIPTSVVLGGEELPVLKNLLEAFSAPTFRPYYSHDRLGVELGGALKNIIAIASGIALGLGYGMNTISAIITRGISEIKRYGEYRKTNRDTYNGLSCVGDLITTCCSEFSRNREYGKSLVNSNSNYQKLAEGALTVQSLIDQIDALDFDMPLCRAVYEIAINKKDASQMMQKLISRPLKEED